MLLDVHVPPPSQFGWPLPMDDFEADCVLARKCPVSLLATPSSRHSPQPSLTSGLKCLGSWWGLGSAGAVGEVWGSAGAVGVLGHASGLMCWGSLCVGPMYGQCLANS